MVAAWVLVALFAVAALACLLAARRLARPHRSPRRSPAPVPPARSPRGR
ncbi:hypothetical protein [Geodermatophilus maliterrae]|uniref:Uncharacterized protein n=1 Tax=Geodermatophilus maliterrae TaxID=3162531 RepID=A0ABV3XAJ2_9ACTN